MSRVAEIKRQVDAGTYVADPAAVAEAMLGWALADELKLLERAVERPIPKDLPIEAHLWERLARADIHPLRIRVFEAMARAGQPMSPTRIAAALGERLVNVNHHFRRLTQRGLFQLTHTERTTGAAEHFYRIAPAPSGAGAAAGLQQQPPLAGAGAGNREGTASTAAASRLAPSTGRAKSPAARSSSGADSDEITTTAIAGSGAEDMEGVGVAPAPTGPSAASGDRPNEHQRRSDQ